MSTNICITVRRSLVPLLIASACTIAGPDTIAATIAPSVTGSVGDEAPRDATPETLHGGFVHATNLPAGSPPIERRGVIEFSLGGISSPIVDAELSVSTSSPASGTVNVYGYVGNGSLDLADYGISGFDFLGSFAAIAATTFMLDVTSFVSDLLGSSATHAGFTLLNATDGESAVFFDGGANAPVLTVQTAVPEPLTLGMLGLGVIGFGLASARRQKRKGRARLQYRSGGGCIAGYPQV